MGKLAGSQRKTTKNRKDFFPAGAMLEACEGDAPPPPPQGEAEGQGSGLHPNQKQHKGCTNGGALSEALPRACSSCSLVLLWTVELAVRSGRAHRGGVTMSSDLTRPVLLRLVLSYVLHRACPRLHAALPRQTKHKFSCT